ncbi:MAG: hypothetical protein AAB932_03630, partial [Patescibacteria group bacterium]
MNVILWRELTCMFISQPQHVISLEERITALLEKYPNDNDMLREATYYPGIMPWTKEKTELAKWRKQWTALSREKQNKALNHLVQSYGWFNNIEGDRPFDREHYRQEIETFHKEPAYTPQGLKISKDIRDIGQLIGELGYLRFWNRWHFMHLRYHIKMALTELVKRSEQPDLEFATIDEVRKYYDGKKTNWKGIRARRKGYVSILK